MADEQQQQPQEEPANSTPPPATSERKDVEKEPCPQSKANDCRYVKQEPPNIYVNIPQHTPEKWSLANKISRSGVIVNFVLAVFTFLLFLKASTQSQVAVDALKESRREFITLYTPVLALGYICYDFEGGSDDPLTPGKPRKIKFDIANIGGHNIFVNSFKYKIVFDSSPGCIDSLINIMKSDTPSNLSSFISNTGASLTLERYLSENPTKEDSLKILKGQCTLYLEMEYYNSITDSARTYLAVVTLKDHKSPQSLIDSVHLQLNKDTVLNFAK